MLCSTFSMGANDLLRRLRRLATRRGWPIDEASGKGAHRKVRLNGRRTVVPMHNGDIPTGTYRQILKDLGLSEEELDV
jgi:predicted RNA binding protein YcfA (HicA-like mRNA interferase family)